MQRATRSASKVSAPSDASARVRRRVPAGGLEPSRPDAFYEAVTGAPDNSFDDRRKGSRRRPDVDRAEHADKPDDPDSTWLPDTWTYVNVSIVISVLICAAIASSLPPPVAISLIIFSIVGGLAIDYVRPLVANRSAAIKAFGMISVVLLPMSCFGLGMALWAGSGGIGWDLAVACLLFLTGMAPAYLRGLPWTVFFLKLSIWLPVTFVLASTAGYVFLFVSLVITMLVTRDVTARVRSEQEKREAQLRVQSRARDILADYEETGQGWFWETDRRSLLTYVSPPVARALRRNPDRLIGQPLTTLFDLADTGDEGERTLMFHLSARSSFSELPVRAAMDKEERWWSITGRPIFDQAHNFVGFRGSGTDLTERRRSQEKATRLARYDALTGLANRFHMSQALEKILSAHAVSVRHCAIMLLDLDRFKQVNDTMGHPAGDALLKQVAQRLERAVGKIGQVGRLGGDEFQVIIPSKVPRETLSALAAEIIHSLSQPYSIDGHRVVIGASVGIAVAPENGTDSEKLIRNADLALYAAKDGGRGRFYFYAEDLHAEAEARAQLEEDLRDALAKDELRLRYQPIVSLETSKISGFEALLRWKHPTKGWISPERFIGIAEEAGLIQSIGEWALREACSALSEWPDEVSIAVNVSPIQFANPKFAAMVANVVSRSQIRASRLELEITESVFLGDDDETDTMFASLKRVGVRLALDDFGTGYSSLGYLKTAPFDKIKIDRSFVKGVTENGSRNGALIASITSLAKSLGMDTTAEGVETQDELVLINEYGCSHAQGFIFDKPLTFEEALERLRGDRIAVVRGPKRSRAARQKLLRKVTLDHEGQVYNGTIRNISSTGAMIEGLWNVPVGTNFLLKLAEDYTVSCTSRWAIDHRMGVEFARPLQQDGSGQIVALHRPAPKHLPQEDLRKAG